MDSRDGSPQSGTHGALEARLPAQEAAARLGPPGARTPSGRRSRPPTALLAAGMLISAAFAAPFAYLLVRNATAGADIVALWTSARILGPLGRSLLIAASVAASSALLGGGLAWLVARTDLPGRALWHALLPLPLVIPSFVGAFSLIAALAPGGLIAGLLRPLGLGERLPSVSGFAGAFIVLTLFTYPYVYLPVAARLRQLPASLEESARLLGHGPGSAFVRVVLPQARGSVTAGALLVFLYTISDFGAVQLMRYDTLTRAIYSDRVYDRTTSLALSLLLAVMAVTVVAAERVLARRPVGPAIAKSTRPLTVALGRWRAAATAGVAGTVAFALVGPLSVLVFWAVRGLVAGSERASALSADLASLAVPALNTAAVSVTAAVVAMVVVLPVAYLTVRHRGKAAALANGVVVGGFALPGLVIALALVYWTLQAPRPVAALVYQTAPLLVFAYVVHFGAQALRASQVAVASMPAGLEDAARMLGARRWRRLLRIELPLMLPGMLAGGGLVLLSTMKELPATLLLAPAGFQTLATTVWSSTEEAFLADASIAALVLVALSGVLTWALVIRQAGALD